MTLVAVTDQLKMCSCKPQVKARAADRRMGGGKGNWDILPWAPSCEGAPAKIEIL